MQSSVQLGVPLPRTPICLPAPCFGDDEDDDDEDEDDDEDDVVVVVIVETTEAVEVAIEQEAGPVVVDKLALPFFIRSFFICSNCLHIAEKEKKRKGSKKNKRITTKQTIFFLIGRLG